MAVVVADYGWAFIPKYAQLAFPDTCCNPLNPCYGGQFSEDSSGFWAPDLTAPSVDDYRDFFGGGPLQKALTRHMGGSNLGFADGHAKWWPALDIFNKGKDGSLYGPTCG